MLSKNLIVDLSFDFTDKEVRETEYWLLLCLKAKKYPKPENSIIDNLKSISNIVSKIIITSKRKK